MPVAGDLRKRNIYDPHEPHSAIEKKPEVNFMSLHDDVHDLVEKRLRSSADRDQLDND